MKNYLLFVLLIATAFNSTAQVNTKYLVRFTDKDNSPYSLSNASDFLSQKAIERRTSQAIPLDITDLPVNPQYVDSVMAKGALVLNRSKWMNAVTVYTSDTNVINAIESLPFVYSVRNVRRVTNIKDPVTAVDVSHNERKSNITGNTQTASLDYGPSYNQINMIGGDYLHDQGLMGQGKVIAVLDAGFKNANALPVFDSLFNSGRMLGTWDFVAGNPAVFEDDGHGMMVLSTMAGYLPGSLIGTAPKASYLLLRTEDAGSEFEIEESNWVSAAEFADSAGADIINSSLGYTTFDFPSQSHTYADMDGNTTIITKGADMAAAKGILVVNSAGNSGGDSWHYIGAPADGDSVFTIGAVDGSGSYASFSSVGPTSDGRLKPNVSAQGVADVVASVFGGIQAENGTSFSSPVIAGMAACLWQAFPQATNMELMQAIEESASQYQNPDYLLGYGIPNFNMALLLLQQVELSRENQPELLTYPNPFLNELSYIYFSNDSQDINVQVYDVQGRMIYNEEKKVNGNAYNKFEISQNWNSGIYFLRLTVGNKIITSRLVKM